MIKLLIVDDSQTPYDALSLGEYSLEYCYRLVEAIELVRRATQAPGLVVLSWDLKGTLAPSDVLGELRRTLPAVPVVVTLRNANVLHYPMKLGATDTLVRPFERAELEAVLKRALHQPGPPPYFADLRERLVGAAPCFVRALEQAARAVAQPERFVLLLGESGTGKTALARAVHEVGWNAGKHGKPFVTCDPHALPENLVETELFGHEKGGYTGAQARSLGRFQEAIGGTLCLEEIGNLPRNIQTKLLHALDKDGSFRPVGGSQDLQFKGRVISVTNMDLDKARSEGSFQEDLYQRLSQIEIRLPALRERRADLRLLAKKILEPLELHGEARKLSASAVAFLEACEFPGNVRELQNILEEAAAKCQTAEITVQDLPLHKMRVLPSGESGPISHTVEHSSSAEATESTNVPVGGSACPGFEFPDRFFGAGVKLADAEAETRLALWAAYLTRNRGKSITELAKQLHVHRDTLGPKLKEAEQYLQKRKEGGTVL